MITESRAHGSVQHFGALDAITTPDDARAWLDEQCGHCRRFVTSAVLAAVMDSAGRPHTWWARCTSCGEPLVKTASGEVYPKPLFGEEILGLPDMVAAAYLEARTCLASGAYTACEMVCRKILMYVAVDKGATPGAAFAAYLSHLEGAGFLTPPMRLWVESIRANGNIAAHELSLSTLARAGSTLDFTAELLRLMYEMEHRRGQWEAE